jgi:hypothetical protein
MDLGIALQTEKYGCMQPVKRIERAGCISVGSQDDTPRARSKNSKLSVEAEEAIPKSMRLLLPNALL